MSLARLGALAASRRGGLLAALVSGLMTAFTLEPFALPGLALVALVPLFFSLAHAPCERAFVARGLLFGVAFYGTTLSWLVSLWTFSWLAVPAALFVIASHACQLFLALIALRVGRLRFGLPALAVAPFAFVVAESLKSFGDLAVPWASLGYGLARPLLLAQVADLVGVAGLTGWLVAVNAASFNLLDRPSRRRLFALGAVLLPVIVYDASCMRRPEPPASLRVGVLQPNVAQEDKWDAALAGRHLETLRRLNAEAVARGAELVVWPEASLPTTLDLDASPWRRLEAEMLGGAQAAVIGATTARSEGRRWHYFNSTILYGGDGRPTGLYHKRRLVPMTEKVPFGPLLGWLVRFIPEALGRLEPGESHGVLRAQGMPPLGSAICFESVFPDLARTERNAGAEILVNVTNDAWFGRSFAPYQHAVFPALRAIEERMPVARSANTGVSALYDSHGRSLARSRIFEQTVLVADLPYGAPPSFYALHGPLIVPTSYAALALLFALALRRPRVAQVATPAAAGTAPDARGGRGLGGHSRSASMRETSRSQEADS